MNIFSLLFKTKKNIKIGLALGSGGAKGFAELGAIFALEQNGITFDYIAGTSIGSIIGAFLANGFTATDIFELLRRVGVGEVLSNLDGSISVISSLFKIIDRNIGSLNIEDLKKPFSCVATEKETGREKVFSSGSVARALSASSSYPPVLKPVEIDGVNYIDGAFVNAIPADLVKKMGADYIIGIDISVQKTKKSAIDKIIVSDIKWSENPREKGYKYSDIMLHPDLTGYTSFSFNQGVEMFDIGYKCAIEHMAQIKKDMERLKKK